MAQVQQLVEAYIELAAVPVAQDAVKPMPVPSAWRRSHRQLHLVPVVSKEVPIDPSGRYDNLAYLVAFGDTMSFVGGINKPKLVSAPLALQGRFRV